MSDRDGGVAGCGTRLNCIAHYRHSREAGSRFVQARIATLGKRHCMTAYRSSLLKLLDERGYIHQVTDAAALDALAREGGRHRLHRLRRDRAILHVGSLVQIMLLRRLQQAGPQADRADGRRHDQGRRPLRQGREPQAAHRRADRREHRRRSAACFERFLTFGDGPTDAIMVNNADWLDELEYIPFLREVGRHFTINRMLTFDSVTLRLDREQPLTFLEFNYMILQAYDFLELSRRAGCRLQLGGSDQWGNIVNGIELGAPDRRDRALRRHDAADHHRRRRQDGQDRRGRGVAQRGPAEPVRLLAVLAEHGGRATSAAS